MNSKQEYYIKNREHILLRQNLYRLENRDKINLYRLENRDKILESQRQYKLKRFECPFCNCNIRYADKAEHFKTKKHIKNLNNTNEII